MDGGTRCRWGQGRAKAIIFSMATEDLNFCIFCFVVGACATSGEDAVGLAMFATGFVIVAVALRLVAWVQDKLYQVLGG